MQPTLGAKKEQDTEALKQDEREDSTLSYADASPNVDGAGLDGAGVHLLT